MIANNNHSQLEYPEEVIRQLTMGVTGYLILVGC